MNIYPFTHTHRRLLNSHIHSNTHTNHETEIFVYVPSGTRWNSNKSFHFSMKSFFDVKLRCWKTRRKKKRTQEKKKNKENGKINSWVVRL